jgi:hypothetical protein
MDDRESTNKKSTSLLRSAAGYYEKTNTYCTNSRAVASRIKSAERCIIALNRPDNKYFGWAGDLQTTVGASFGSLKQRKVGFYITFRFNMATFDYAEEINRTRTSTTPYRRDA